MVSYVNVNNEHFQFQVVTVVRRLTRRFTSVYYNLKSRKYQYSRSEGILSLCAAELYLNIFHSFEIGIANRISSFK